MARTRIRQLPPVAVPVVPGDLWRGMAALRDPAASVERFRAALARLTGRDACFLVSSGRAALTLVLLALKRTADRTQVVVPAYTCPTVAQSVLAAGLEPVFCDVSPHTLAFDEDGLARAMARRPLAVVPTYMYGLAHRLDRCLELARLHDVEVIEDAAQSLGARIDGRMAGTLADVGFYSFGPGKCLPIGCGGVIVAGPRLAPAIAATIRERVPGPPRRGGEGVARLLAYGLMTRPAGWWIMARSPMNPQAEGMDETRLPSVRVGGFPSASAGIGLSLLARLDRIEEGRRRNAQRLAGALAPFDWAKLPMVSSDIGPVFLRFPVIVDRRERADGLFRRLGELGVSRSYYRTLPDLYARLVASAPGDFPGADVLAARLLTLPTHPYLETADVEQIAEAFEKTER
jgi:dTDP-4-amino-4,6-dideoxygalactose transaminase